LDQYESKWANQYLQQQPVKEQEKVDCVPFLRIAQLILIQADI
jgi:hypothetical protein